jgi:hypothetical protein
MEPFRGANFSCLQEEDLDAVAAAVGGEAGRRHVIVDGSNAVHAVAVDGRDHANARTLRARGRLLEIVADALAGRRVTVVFDGRDDGSSASGLDVVHAPDGDEWIIDSIAEAADPAMITVVTSDRELTRRVAELGAMSERPRSALGRSRT